MKKFITIIFVSFILSGLVVFGKTFCNKNDWGKILIFNKITNNQYKSVTQEKQNKEEDKKNAKRKYYIKNDTDINLKFLCFNENECYSLNPNIIEVKNKKFVGFEGNHYFDLSTYKYDKNTHTYFVDIVVDRDPFTDLEINDKSPYDKGNITHLIFSLIYRPLTNKMEATYKGFISSEDRLEYVNGKVNAIDTNYINVYYDNNPKYIKDLSSWLEFFNKDIPKTIGKANSFGYDVEIEYIIPYYIH